METSIYAHPTNTNESGNASTAANNSTLNELDPVFLCGTGDGSRMEISATEKHQALRIKAAIEANPEIDPVSDFECVQLALVDGDNVAKSLERAHHFQVFREEYKLQNSYEDYHRIMSKFLELLPEAILSISYHEIEQNYVLVADMAKFDEAVIKTQQDERTLMGATYVCMQSMCPDFYAIRKGCFIIVECQGYEKTRWSLRARRGPWSVVLCPYPFKILQLKYFNTGMWANLAVSLLKRFVPNPIYQKIQVGCQSPLGRLDAFYSLPNRQAANQRLLERMDTSLRTRFHHIKNFQLREEPPANEVTIIN